MGLIETLLLAWKNKDKIKTVSSEVETVVSAYKATPASGLMTSEFLGMALTAAIGIYNTFAPQHPMDPKLSFELAAGIVALFGAYRTFLKAWQQLMGPLHVIALALHQPAAPAAQPPAPAAAPAPVAPPVPK